MLTLRIAICKTYEVPVNWTLDLVRDFRERSENERWYIVYTVFSEPLFYGAVLIQYLIQVAHVSLAKLFYFEVVAALLIAVMEIVTGSLADHIGRRKTVVVGRAILFVFTCLLAMVATPWDMFFANLLWAIGFACCSGADEALIFDAAPSHLLKREKGEWYMKLESRGESLGLIARSVGALFSGVLYTIHPRLPIYVTIPGLALALYAAWRLKEVMPVEVDQQEKGEPTTQAPGIGEESEIQVTKKAPGYSFMEHRRILVAGLNTVAHSKVLRWVILLPALVAVTGKLWFFCYNPYFESVGIATWMYGPIFFTLNIVAAIVAHNASNIQMKLGEFRTAVIFVFAMTVPMMLMGIFVSPLAVVFIFVGNFSRGITSPFKRSLQHRHIVDSKLRATIISVGSTVRGIVEMVLELAFALYLGATSRESALIFFAALATLLGAWMLGHYRAVFGSWHSEHESASVEVGPENAIREEEASPIAVS